MTSSSLKMPFSTDHHVSHMPFASFRRSILGFRTRQIHSMEASYSKPRDSALESFEKKISSHFRGLSAAAADDDSFLSVEWMRKLLDAFISCQDEFMFILSKNRPQLSKPPLDSLLLDYFDRTIKALDLCNAARDGIEKIRLWLRHLEIVLSAFDYGEKMMGEGQFRRARKALIDLACTLSDEKETAYSSVLAKRNMSFGRHTTKTKDHNFPPRLAHSRSLSCSFSQSWSAAKQLQLIASTLSPPRQNDIVATDGLAVAVFAMSCVQMFVLWILVVAVPCQGRSPHVHVSIPQQFAWCGPIRSIHSRIMDEFKKRELQSTNGMLREIYQIEKCVQRLRIQVDSAKFPLPEAQKTEMRAAVDELSRISATCNDGVEPFERHLRDVFRKIMNCRTDGLDTLNTNQPH